MPDTRLNRQVDSIEHQHRERKMNHPKHFGMALALSLMLVNACADTSSDHRSTIARAWDGHPDLNGIWQTLSTANWNLEPHPSYGGLPAIGALGATPPGPGAVAGGEIPYQSWARQQQQQNFSNRFTQDTEAKCYLPGIPRANYMPYPFQILQGTGKIMMVYGFAEANRTIHMDKAQPEPAPIDSWMGRSHGYWEGDTLVVEAHGFNGEAWLDRAGNFSSYALTVEERFTPVDANTMRYEATLTDSEVYTRPWTISLLLHRNTEPNAELLEYKCVEYSEELLYGHLRRGAGAS